LVGVMLAFGSTVGTALLSRFRAHFFLHDGRSIHDELGCNYMLC
jgi:hypothetical protein